MTREVSLYLDLSRSLAALLVMLYHFSYERFSGGLYSMYFDHEAVIVFFILSGYVISFVADTKENNMKSYFVSRFSRLYSVVLPVLLLIPLLDMIGQYVDIDIGVLFSVVLTTCLLLAEITEKKKYIYKQHITAI